MIRKYLLTILLGLSIGPAGFGQGEQLVVNLPSLSGRHLFTFENPKGSIKVTGYEGSDIVINAASRFPGTGKNDGNSLKRIDRNTFDIYAESDGINVTLFCRDEGKTIDFDIKIPRRFSLKLKSLDNGTIQVININGDIEADNSNGDVTLENISGSAVLNSVYGKILATFSEVRPDYPMMFTSLEGDISINLPEKVNAVLKMKTGTGEIYSDFDLIPLKRQPVIKNVENTKVYSLEDWVVDKVNSGGPEYVVRSYSGNIYVKKNKRSGNF
jgi:hypothetical protein